MADDEGAGLHGAGLEDRGLVRLGETVRRPAGLWTDSVHHLLRHLRNRGFDEAPEPLGRDAKAGRFCVSCRGVTRTGRSSRRF